jgi:hypothetical protein
LRARNELEAAQRDLKMRGKSLEEQNEVETKRLRLERSLGLFLAAHMILGRR